MYEWLRSLHEGQSGVDRQGTVQQRDQLGEQQRRHELPFAAGHPGERAARRRAMAALRAQEAEQAAREWRVNEEHYCALVNHEGKWFRPRGCQCRATRRVCGDHT